jgi:hypothetical protein
VGAANLQAVTILACTEGGLVMALGQYQVTIPLPVGRALDTGETVQLCIRPETLSIDFIGNRLYSAHADLQRVKKQTA